MKVWNKNDHCNSLIFSVLVVYEGFEGKKGEKCILKGDD